VRPHLKIVSAARAMAHSVLRVAAAPNVLRTATGRSGWLWLLRHSGTPEQSQVPLGKEVARKLSTATTPTQGALFLSVLAESMRTESGRVDLLATAAEIQLNAGLNPPALRKIITSNLSLADEQLRAGRPGAAAVWLARAAGIAFHRTIQFDTASPELASSPNEYLAPFRSSTTFCRLTPTAPPKAREQKTAPQEKILFISFKNWNFLDGIINQLGDCQHRRLDLADIAGVPLSPLQLLRSRLTSVDTSSPWYSTLQENIEWADTVWVEWGQRAAVVLSLLDTSTARVIVRIHSFEAFSIFPHLINWESIDDVIVVSPHMEKFCRSLLPQLSTPHHVPIHSLPNFMQLSHLSRPKTEAAKHTLGMVGWGNITKDPIWTLELLSQLRSSEKEWCLRLIGRALDPSLSPANAQYFARFNQYIDEHDLRSSIEYIDFTNDLAAELQNVGVIVSSSIRESFHAGFVEGAASGCIPVVRDWPAFAQFGGPETLFPAEWIAVDPAQAHDRVMSLCSSAANRESASRGASQFSIDQFDWSHVYQQYQQFIPCTPLPRP
jgi:glycosyltransferase involved in cell wall biosynthesis